MNRILVVEDDQAIANGIAVNLQYAGYAYNVFDDGLRAAEYLESDHAFDLALLDIMLPGLDGFELFDIVRKYAIPVIFITAKTDSASEIKGLRDGAEDYIVKPFEVLTLLVRIEKVLARSGKLNPVIHYLDFTVDIENRTVFKSDVEIPLKPLEFDVFVMLVRCKNRTVPRERLLNEIWGVDYFGGTRTVDVHISNLRKKLWLETQIRSVSKIGYRLEE